MSSAGPWQRRRRLAAAAAVLASLCAAAALAAPSQDPGPAGDPRPNLLVIVTDDQTVESMRVMDAVRSRIGASGATFERSYVNFPLCCPSRATLLTGQYAHNHRVLDNEPPAGGYERFQDLHGTDNLAIWLQDAGYRTALVGKYLNDYGDEHPRFVPRGWDDWLVAAPPAQHVYDYELNENGRLVHYGSSPSDFKGDVIADRAIELIEKDAALAEPFFVEVGFTAPHAGGPNPSPQPPRNCPASPKPPPRFAHAFDDEPLPRPPSFNEGDVSDKPIGVRTKASIGPRARKRLEGRYRCSLEALLGVDDSVGRMLDALEATGELDNTLIVFTSDNGFFFGEHRIAGGKLRHYEESARVPLLISGPGVEAGLTIEEPVINADLAPTLLAAAGAKPDAVLDGISLLPLAGGEAPAAGVGRDLLLENGHYAAVRSGRYVYVELGTAASPGARELYDLEADPYELHNLAESPRYRAVVGDLAARLRVLRSCSGTVCSQLRAPPAG